VPYARRFNHLAAAATHPNGGRLLTRRRKSSRRVPSVFTTERDSNSATTCAPCSYDNSEREYCYEEGSFRGAPFCTATLADPLVNAPAPRVVSLGVSRFLPFWQGFASNAKGYAALSVSRFADRGAVATFKVGSEPRIFVLKLSDSLINRRCGVNSL
jgi:hypothetical protein